MPTVGPTWSCWNLAQGSSPGGDVQSPTFPLCGVLWSDSLLAKKQSVDMGDTPSPSRCLPPSLPPQIHATGVTRLWQAADPWTYPCEMICALLRSRVATLARGKLISLPAKLWQGQVDPPSP